ncbi:hypothetical protein V491_00018 [Pseudogymnoascus sp. VKM F-3775]|nr:hypothetical protein V491_00018 [Pseudogymnoascus sp. VKM F-3775]
MGSAEVFAMASELNPESTACPLHVCIAGAGIGGLSAAIALRQAGHRVVLYESSRFAVEIGAAIHLPPNVNGLLRRFGTRPEEWGANQAEHVTLYSKDGSIISTKNIAGVSLAYPYPWQLSHRVDLHEELKRLATTLDGPGIPAIIKTQSQVISCDPEAPLLVLKDGTVVGADMVLGADGVHSVLRRIITGQDNQPQSSGGSAFRFLVPVSQVKADPRTAWILERSGELQLWEGTNRRLVIYPCRNNTELNFVCLHPEIESAGSKEGWNNSASKQQLLTVYDEYCEGIKVLLSMADESSIRLWKLLDYPSLPTWINNKAALLGDAAHPFLPYQGQGGAQAIEDGAALGALFPLGVKPSEVPERLKLYMKCRYDRATLVQNFSRAAAFKHSDSDVVGGISTDPLEFSKINFGHDAHDNAQAILLNYLASKAAVTTVSGIFGPLPGPTQDAFGNPRSMPQSSYFTSYITFKTHLNYLRTFLPLTSSLQFAQPGGWATATLALTKHTNVPWLGYRSYSRLGLYLHNVQDSDGDKPALYCAAAFEDSVDAVVAHREAGKVPVFFAQLAASFSPTSFSLSASWEGRPILLMSLKGLFETKSSEEATPFSPPEVTAKANTGIWGAEKADLTYTQLEGSALAEEFPTLFPVVERLRGITLQEVTK